MSRSPSPTPASASASPPVAASGGGDTLESHWLDIDMVCVLVLGGNFSLDMTLDPTLCAFYSEAEAVILLSKYL